MLILGIFCSTVGAFYFRAIVFDCARLNPTFFGAIFPAWTAAVLQLLRVTLVLPHTFPGKIPACVCVCLDTPCNKNKKVNAVKNEEASQVSRLEEEIKALKQKLLAQQGAASPSFLPSPSSAAASLGGEGGRAVAGAEGDGRGRGTTGGARGGEDGGGGDR